MSRGRLEEELEEILRKAQMPAQRRVRRWRLRPVPVALSPSILLIVGIVLLVLALVASGPLRVGLFWAGLGLLVVAYAAYWVRQKPRQVEKWWRGRPVDTSPGWWERLRHPFRR